MIIRNNNISKDAGPCDSPPPSKLNYKTQVASNPSNQTLAKVLPRLQMINSRNHHWDHHLHPWNHPPWLICFLHLNQLRTPISGLDHSRYLNISEHQNMNNLTPQLRFRKRKWLVATNSRGLPPTLTLANCPTPTMDHWTASSRLLHPPQAPFHPRSV